MKLLAILDTETTCLVPKEGHLLEVGVVRFDVATATVVDQWSMLVEGATKNPAERVNRIPVSLVQAHGIHVAQVTTALAHHIMPCDAILAHNAPFDRAWCEHHLELQLPKPWLDTKEDFDWWEGKPGDSLVALAVAHGVPVVSAHRALTDCMLIAGILQANCGAKDTSEEGHLEKILALAARPRVLLQSKHDFKANEAAAGLGFRFDRPSKRWLKRHVKGEPIPAALWPIVEVPS